MEQKPEAQGGTPPSADQSQSQAPSAPTRPAIPERAETALPGHLKPSVTAVPVTPGIDLGAYDAQDETPVEGGEPAGGYFARKVVDHNLAPSPAPVDKHQSAEGQIKSGAEAGKDFLQRLRLAAMGSQDSLSDIRAKYPSLSLSGNIISATFTVPVGLKYRKGADWVSI